MIEEKFMKGLSELVAFKSISTDPEYKKEVENIVEWISSRFAKNGFTVQQFSGKKCNPVIFAEYIADESYESVMVYGHYDVQPADSGNGWESDPFTLEERDGRLYGRGVVDNKGQFWIHMYTVLKLIEEGALKYNVKFLIEGNEETSNEDLPDIMSENSEILKTDYVMISDGEILGENPVVEISLRGGFSMKLTYTGGHNNVHSGIYGGAVPNSAYELSKFVAGLYDEDNSLTIPGFYDDVDQITAESLDNNRKISKNSEHLLEHAGFKKLLTETGNDYFTQIGMRPTIQVSGIKSGYTGDGFANIVPAKAEVRLNFRTVASQNSDEVIEMFTKYIADNTPDYIGYEIEVAGKHEPVKIDISKPIVSHVESLLEKSFGEEVLLKPVGGAIPVVGDIKELWGIDTLLVSLGNDDCNMHGPNENYRVDLVEKGLAFSDMFFRK